MEKGNEVRGGLLQRRIVVEVVIVGIVLDLIVRGVAVILRQLVRVAAEGNALTLPPVRVCLILLS